MIHSHEAWITAKQASVSQKGGLIGRGYIEQVLVWMRCGEVWVSCGVVLCVGCRVEWCGVWGVEWCGVWGVEWCGVWGVEWCGVWGVEWCGVWGVEWCGVWGVEWCGVWGVEWCGVWGEVWGEVWVVGRQLLLFGFLFRWTAAKIDEPLEIQRPFLTQASNSEP